MAKSFRFEIVTPEKLFYHGKAELVIARTLSGDEGFMAGHSWAFKLLGTGELWFKEAGAKDFKLAAISGGFIDVSDNVLIFTDSAEWPEEIDIGRANAAGLREQEWLETHKAGDKTRGRFFCLFPSRTELSRRKTSKSTSRRQSAPSTGKK